jgi:hypothetical protein
MTGDPKANPDVLPVDGPTRDAIIEALRSHKAESVGDQIVGPDTAASFIEARFPVSAEPSPNLSALEEMLTEAGLERSPDDGEWFSRDGGLSSEITEYGPTSAAVLRVLDATRAEAAMAWDAHREAMARLEAPEPSPNPLREALREIAAMPDVQRNPDGDDQAAATMKLVAREALAADQSQSDRTSDEATPAEPVYESLPRPLDNA